jgi:predicted AlkP superfamily phosphohydrolase/phosphomutase
MTGMNPGKHGVFQWRTYDPTKYTCLDERLMTSARLAGRTFWDILGNSGYRVGVVTVPMTYPPWEVNGFLVSGYPCPDTRQNYTDPPQWAEDLAEPYNFSADYYLHASQDTVWRQGLEMLERRASLAIRLIEEEHVEVCVVVLGEIDRAQHDFWKYVDPRFPAYHTAEGGRYREVIAEHYQVCDAQIGRMLEHVGVDTLVVIMSDHGGGPHPPKLFHTNAWLRDMGWLVPAGASWARLSNALRRALGLLRQHFPFEERLRRRLPAQVVDNVRQVSMNIAGVNWSRTRAYRFPMYHPAEGIEINLRGRQPEGVVEPGEEFNTLREEIIAALAQLRDPVGSTPIADKVYRREELYRGPYRSIAPDIVFVAAPDYKADSGLLGAFVGPTPLAGLDKYSGLHTLDGIFIARGRSVRRGYTVTHMEIADVAPTILYELDEVIPGDVDGHVRTDVFVPSVSRRRPKHQAKAEQGADVSAALSEEEEQQMRDKLRALGYLE